MKFYGAVGFFEGMKETTPGVYRPSITERPYYGEVIKDHRKFQPSSSQNDEFTVSNRISILADLYAQENWTSIRYVIWNGVKWKVTSVDVTYPRLTLELGGVYNGTETTGIT